MMMIPKWGNYPGDGGGGITLVIDREFAFTVEALNRGLMRVGYETCFGRPEAQIRVSLWGVPEDENAALRRRLVDALDGVFA